MAQKKLKIALVGRPNVGKSALFNRIAKKNIAIVDPAEGITRDRLYADAENFGIPFEIIDTGGINPGSEDPFQEELRRQTEIAIEEADRIIMVVDAIVGATVRDEFVARLLLKTKKPVILAANKVDDLGKLALLYPFYSFGISKVIAVSASQGFQIAELLEEALSGIIPEEEIEQLPEGLCVAIVGRPNVGKSTLVNFLLDESRCAVSPIAGTTRDSVDVSIEVGGNRFNLIDTAGIRRKGSEHETVDKFAAIRTERALERADVCICLLDAVRGPTIQDLKILKRIEEMGKGCIIAFNKWDLVKGVRMEHCLKSLHDVQPFLAHCPTLFISAQTGRHVDDLLPTALAVEAEQKRRVTTGQLNKFVEQTLQQYHPPMLGGKRLRIYYLAQVDVKPPRFVLFVNKPELMVETYKKYMINQFRKMYGFTGSPIQFFLKGRQSSEKEEKAEIKALPKPSRPKVSSEEILEEIFEEESSELDPSYFN